MGWSFFFYGEGDYGCYDPGPGSALSDVDRPDKEQYFGQTKCQPERGGLEWHKIKLKTAQFGRVPYLGWKQFQREESFKNVKKKIRKINQYKQYF